MLGLATFKGGEKVPPGHYWNVDTGDQVAMTAPGSLPGGPEDRYYRIPPAGVLAMAPLLGLAYAVFLPFVGIAMVAGAVGRKLLGGVTEQVWKAASFGWQPTEAYLTGKPSKKRGRRAKAAEKEQEPATKH